MLKNFLHVYNAIKVIINSSKLKVFKNKSLILTDIKLNYLRNILNILIIFVKVTTKLQAENYPIIYYIIPEIYKIYN
jgi:Na+-translocating ferredoxin:NAD+ oxidoreductase RnfA subunit